ncbi:MAG TPA: hypothetical protein VFK15_07175, partial [Burkholderiales bacterium]|nr:hypothetical protein [Burkholderiales bacterium]
LTVPSAGKYAVYGNLKLNNVTANNYIAIQLGRYNSSGVLQEVLATTNNMIAATGSVSCSTAGAGNFSSGDYAMMIVFSVDTNTDIHTDTTFEIRKLS